MVDELPQADLDRCVVDVVSRSPVPSLVIEVPSGLIVVASPSAARLLEPAGGDVVYRHLEDFLAGEPTGALELLLSRKVQGYRPCGTGGAGMSLPSTSGCRHFATSPRLATPSS
jgi:hypothetical protein